MKLTLDANAAKAADNTASAIRETGKYIGTITRAELLVSERTGTVGLGLGIKTSAGQEANYLDLWHTKGNGEQLSAWKTVNAVMCCAKVAECPEGVITIEAWNSAIRQRERVQVNGYPALMGKRIGLLLRKTLETDRDGKDRDRMEIVGVFNADTELTASEMYAKATEPKKLGQMLDMLLAKPVRDARKKGASKPAAGSADDPFGDMHDDQPF